MTLSQEQLDKILTLQFAVAWAGESGEDEPRLRWWNTDMVSEFGGQALLQRLAPTTWEWATLEVVREAARREDAKARGRDAEPDRLVSLFRLGFETDEQLQDRLLELKRSGATPKSALPELFDATEKWEPARFQKWLSQGSAPKVAKEPSGRRLTQAPPSDPTIAAQSLAHALLPFSDDYPCPHYRDPDATR